jgi:hypothetical protein
VERFYPIGTPGTPWGEREREQWRARQVKSRSYVDDVVGRVRAFGAAHADAFDVVEYGTVSGHPLLALVSRGLGDARPVAVVTGGVHGYETSGVHGALMFLEQHATALSTQVALVVVPCVSPWAYERIQRWNEDAIDPNRSFKESARAAAGERLADESQALLTLLEVFSVRARAALHIDLHETTDTDESEFRPAVAARDGKEFKPGGIPDGFYLVDDTVRPQPAFQAAVIAAVEQVTKIAPADDEGEMIGCPVVAHGVIRYPVKELGLCAGVTDARFVTTTEVYPDAPGCSADECNRAQVAAVRAALAFVVAQP